MTTQAMEEARRQLGYSVGPSYDYVPSLDGIRAVSVALVVISHAGLSRLVPGGFGVTVFFFISGFLITRQLLAEQASRGQVALGAFYIRRLLRLYPALLTMLAVGGTLCYLLGAAINWRQVLAGIFYYTNFNTWFVPYSYYPDGMYHPFAILWSLAVEEHYYLVFPALVFLLGRSRLKFVLALCVAIALFSLWRLHIADACSVVVPQCIGDKHDFRIVQGTDTRLDSILYGTVLATLLGTSLGTPLLKILQTRASFLAGMGLLLLSLLWRDPLFRDSTRFVVQGIGLFFTVGSALFSPHFGWVRRLLSLRPVLLLGRWSYSLYLWHSVVLMSVVSCLPEWVWRPAVEHGHFTPAWDLIGIPAVVVIATAISALSYKYVEMPMVAIRRRFGSHAVRDGAPIRVSPLAAPSPSTLA